MQVCAADQLPMSSLSRFEFLSYFFNYFLYFTIVAAPVVGLVFGCYLWLSVNQFEAHYNESFSALSVSSYKNFLRMHVLESGDLEVFVLGIDKIPARWVLDPCWSGNDPSESGSSHSWRRPSRWISAHGKLGNMLKLNLEDQERISLKHATNTEDRSKVKVVDFFVLGKNASY